MDHISSFVQEGCSTHELTRFCSSPSQQQQILSQTEGPFDLTNNAQYMHMGKTSGDTNEDTKLENKKSKIDHKDIKRQRTQEMATLYRTLRSLLPIDYLKGKRSVSDHIQEAINYIRHLEDKIQALKDELRELSNSSSTTSKDNILESSDERDALTVKPCLVGVEVVIDTGLRKSFPLSGVLQVLIEEGLSIVSCSSTKVKERMLHTIISQVSGEKCIDISTLEQKLTNSTVWPVN
ncbi:hypothetical protein JCGZ_20704 [Jatropha curcas]|uniref:BHLH domain-containing protein n=1 Tax=Jatropha curcas TaxID=180498 RepID=A0A067JRT1_JATCU|nr:transcription factor bHLH118 [Jatropha curcas]KDP25548.1 hypothetical protein JCGZ_20704 [Jatropha curcas]